MFSFLQGLPGFIGPVGEAGIAGEKVSTLSIFHAVVIQRPFLAVKWLSVCVACY